MSARITGLAILANPRPSLANSQIIYFDANFWLAQGLQLSGCFRYYNLDGDEFNGDQFACTVDASVGSYFKTLSFLCLLTIVTA